MHGYVWSTLITSTVAVDYRYRISPSGIRYTTPQSLFRHYKCLIVCPIGISPRFFFTRKLRVAVYLLPLYSQIMRLTVLITIRYEMLF